MDHSLKIAKFVDFILYRYLADDHTEEISKVLDFRRLEFLDVKMESDFKDAYSKVIFRPHRRLIFVAVIGLSALIAWSFLLRQDPLLLPKNIVRSFGILVLLVASMQHRLPWYKLKYELHSVWYSLWFTLFTTTFYYYGMDYFRPVILQTAVPMESLHNLSLVVSFAIIPLRRMYIGHFRYGM